MSSKKDKETAEALEEIKALGEPKRDPNGLLAF
jgi:hypothetical protein